MAEEEEYKSTKEIDDFYKRKDIATIILDTRVRHRMKAYGKAVDEILTDKKTGKVHMEWLKDEKIQEKFQNTMANLFRDEAMKDLGIEKLKGETEFEKQLHENFMIREYYGITRNDLGNMIKRHGENFTQDQYNKSWYKHHKNVEENLMDAAGSHVKEQHIDDILKYIRTSDGSAYKHLDSKAMRKEEAIGLLAEHDKGKKIFHKDILAKTFPQAYKGEIKKYKAPSTIEEEKKGGREEE